MLNLHTKYSNPVFYERIMVKNFKIKIKEFLTRTRDGSYIAISKTFKKFNTISLLEWSPNLFSIKWQWTNYVAIAMVQ